MLLQNFVEEASVAALAFTSMSKHDNMAKEKTNTRQVMHEVPINNWIIVLLILNSNIVG